jgi:multicomponent Na+:H+ antiporter subunit D
MTIVALPILVPFVLIISLLIFRTPKTCRWVGPAGSVALIAVSLLLFINLKEHGILTLNMGGWVAPFGIVLVIDYLSTLMLLVASFILTAISFFAIRFLPAEISVSRFFVFFFSLANGR